MTKDSKGQFRPGNEIGKETRFKLGCNPKRVKKKPSLLKELERLCNTKRTIRVNGELLELSYLEWAAFAYWKRVMKGEFHHLKLMLAYFDGQPPQTPDPALSRTPEDNAKLIMQALSEMDVRNNGHSNGTSDGSLVSAAESSRCSRVSEQLDEIQRGTGGSEILQDGDGEAENNPQGTD